MLETFLVNNSSNILHLILIGIGYLMPIPLAIAAFHLWHEYRQERFIMGIEWVLLEIQVPRDVIKTPASMELIFSNAFYHKSQKGFWEIYIQGAPWMWFSLEMVSIDGRVHFFIRTPSRMRKLVENQIYGQYPQAKVIESDDYTRYVSQYKENGDWYMWGCEFEKMDDDAKPIKLWRKMDEMKPGTKEEVKVDPITPTIEYLGSLAKGEQVWIQIIVRQSIKKYKSNNSYKKLEFKDHAQEYLENLLAPYTKLGKGSRKGGGDSMEVRAPSFLDPVVKAVVATMQQIHFDCGIRLVTLANKKYRTEDDFGKLRRSSRLLFRQYAEPLTNQFHRVNSTQFDAPWSDPTGLALTRIKKRMLNFYRHRTFFHPPVQNSFKYPFLISQFLPSHNPKILVLSSEELATIFHFPGMVSATPSFKRVDSKIAKPPTNLPT